MSANLSPEYISAERDYKSAQSHDEKLAALERMLSTIPKHKGTEKLQADIKRRLSRLRKEGQKKGPRMTPFWIVKKEGAGQVALTGPPNAGKSQLVAALTHAHPEVAAYPFTTRKPVPGMMNYQNVQIQLIDLPPISAEFTESWIPQVIRTADLSLLVVDTSDVAVLEEIEFVLALYEQHRLSPPELLLGNKSDLPGALENLEALRELYGDRFRYLPVSATRGDGLDLLARQIFLDLNLVRFYSKPPGKPADMSKPYVLHRGQTVVDAAREVHRDFADAMKFTRLYHIDGHHSGLMVERTHVVEDQDILEFHI
jgi:small GTP-binding protein